MVDGDRDYSPVTQLLRCSPVLVAFIHHIPHIFPWLFVAFIGLGMRLVRDATGLSVQRARDGAW